MVFIWKSDNFGMPTGRAASDHSVDVSAVMMFPSSIL
jgi:hypothetical protein